MRIRPFYKLAAAAVSSVLAMQPAAQTMTPGDSAANETYAEPETVKINFSLLSENGNITINPGTENEETLRAFPDAGLYTLTDKNGDIVSSGESETYTYSLPSEKDAVLLLKADADDGYETTLFTVTYADADGSIKQEEIPDFKNGKDFSYVLTADTEKTVTVSFTKTESESEKEPETTQEPAEEEEKESETKAMPEETKPEELPEEPAEKESENGLQILPAERDKESDLQILPTEKESEKDLQILPTEKEKESDLQILPTEKESEKDLQILPAEREKESDLQILPTEKESESGFQILPTEPEAESEALSETQSETPQEPESEVQSEAASESETQSETASEAQSETVQELEREPQSEAASEDQTEQMEDETESEFPMPVRRAPIRRAPVTDTGVLNQTPVPSNYWAGMISTWNDSDWPIGKVTISGMKYERRNNNLGAGSYYLFTNQSMQNDVYVDVPYGFRGVDANGNLIYYTTRYYVWTNNGHGLIDAKDQGGFQFTGVNYAQVPKSLNIDGTPDTLFRMRVYLYDQNGNRVPAGVQGTLIACDLDTREGWRIDQGFDNKITHEYTSQDTTLARDSARMYYGTSGTSAENVNGRVQFLFQTVGDGFFALSYQNSNSNKNSNFVATGRRVNYILTGYPPENARTPNSFYVAYGAATSGNPRFFQAPHTEAPGYRFKGWGTNPDDPGGSIYQGVSMMSSDLTLYGLYERIAVNVVLEKSAAENPSRKVEGATYNLSGTGISGKVYNITGKTNSDGRITFPDIEQGSYSIRETGTTSGYFLDTKTHTLTVDANANAALDGTYLGGGTVVWSTSDKTRVHADLSFTKRDIVTLNPIGGAAFTLSGTSEYGTKVNTTVSADSLGNVYFHNIEKGTYTLTEQNVSGYIPQGKTGSLKVEIQGDPAVSPDGKAVYTFTPAREGDTTEWFNGQYEVYYNEPYHQIYFTKKSASMGEPVEGAQFELTGTSDYGLETKKTATSGSDGKVLFDGLEPGTYDIRETKTPPGYVSAEKTGLKITASVHTDGKFELSGNEDWISGGGYEWEVTNEETYTLKLLKSDALDNTKALEGAMFKLSGTSNYGTEVLDVQTSGKDGRLQFQNLEAGTYELSEVTPPKGYINPRLSGVRFTVTVRGNGKITVTATDSELGSKLSYVGTQTSTWKIYNEPLHSVEFKKVSFEDTNTGIGAAQFHLTGTSIYENNADIYATSDEDGIVRFDGLEPGTYTIRETTPPDGYVRLGNLDQEITVKVKDDGSYIFYQNGEDVTNSETEEAGAKKNLSFFLTMLDENGEEVPEEEAQKTEEAAEKETETETETETELQSEADGPEPEEVKEEENIDETENK